MTFANLPATPLRIVVTLAALIATREILDNGKLVAIGRMAKIFERHGV